MSSLYRVEASQPPHYSDPLHWGNFYPGKQRHHAGVMNKRQDLILFLARLHADACSSGMPLGMIRIPMRLTSLREWCSDYRVALDHFFEVDQLGYNLGEGKHEITTLIPRKLSTELDVKASQAGAMLKYSPGPAPLGSDTVISKVYVQQDKAEAICNKLVSTCRLDLFAPVEWLLTQPEINFHFKRSGRLQQRDTSVWPVAGIETWPSWLREDLFGPGLDIESAYTQFLIAHLREVYVDKPELLELLYPDLMRSLTDKAAWRVEICDEVLGLIPTPENIGIVKRLCMSLANGSRISPAILTGSRAFSVTADIVVAAAEDVSIDNLTRIGKRLSVIAKQYVSARKMLCLALHRRNPTRRNQKDVFSSYFEWERAARYMIWEAVDRHGIMVHDGIDGIPQQYLDKLPEIMSELNLRITT